jgi:hypothetical protein
VNPSEIPGTTRPVGARVKLAGREHIQLDEWGPIEPALAAPTHASPSPQAAPPACELSARDAAWLERALEAWRFTCREITGIDEVTAFRAIFFDASCVLSSADALTSLTAEGVTWTAAPHSGTVAMPDGSEVPAGVTSFASGEDGLHWFAMSTPSVWEAGGAGKGADLERTMIAVMLHEGSHVAQIGPYGKRLGALIERESLPDSFNDDAVQERFGADAEFAASVARETQLFLDAAAAADDTEARLLAYEARELMRERAARWLVGDDAWLAEAEDLWLTYEGSGQWAGFSWLVHPQGAAQDRAETLRRFGRDRSWSQAQGFALALALDRIVGPAWKRHAFGDGAQTLLEMLDDALEDG